MNKLSTLLILIFIFTPTVSFAADTELLADPPDLFSIARAPIFSLSGISSLGAENSHAGCLMLPTQDKKDIKRSLVKDREFEEDRQIRKAKKKVEKEKRGGAWLDDHKKIKVDGTISREDNGVQTDNDSIQKSIEEELLEEIIGDNRTSLQNQYNIPAGTVAECQGGDTKITNSPEELGDVARGEEGELSLVINVGEEGFQGVLDPTRQLLDSKRMRSLEINNINSFSADILSDPNSSLEELTLRSNIDSGFHIFLPFLHSLKKLTMSGCFTISRTREFIEILPQLTSLSLREWDLSNSFLDNEVTELLGDVLLNCPLLRIKIRPLLLEKMPEKIRKVIKRNKNIAELYRLLFKYVGVEMESDEEESDEEESGEEESAEEESSKKQIGEKIEDLLRKQHILSNSLVLQDDQVGRDYLDAQERIFLFLRNLVPLYASPPRFIFEEYTTHFGLLMTDLREIMYFLDMKRPGAKSFIRVLSDKMVRIRNERVRRLPLENSGGSEVEEDGGVSEESVESFESEFLRIFMASDDSGSYYDIYPEIDDGSNHHPSIVLYPMMVGLIFSQEFREVLAQITLRLQQKEEEGEGEEEGLYGAKLLSFMRQLQELIDPSITIDIDSLKRLRGFLHDQDMLNSLRDLFVVRNRLERRGEIVHISRFRSDLPESYRRRNIFMAGLKSLSRLTDFFIENTAGPTVVRLYKLAILSSLRDYKVVNPETGRLVRADEVDIESSDEGRQLQPGGAILPVRGKGKTVSLSLRKVCCAIKYQ